MTGWPPTVELLKTPNLPILSIRTSQQHRMPSQAHTDLAASYLKSLAYMTLIIAVSTASPIPQSIGERGTGIDSPEEDRMSIKNVLEWLFAAAAVIIVGLVFLSRTLFLRARNRPLREFFAFIEAPRPRGGSSRGSTRPSPDDTTPPSPDRRVRERTRGTDIDSEGRRAGGPDPDDADGDPIEKDPLPAYEVKGGPPNYSHFLAVDLGTSTNARLQITETVPMGRPQSQSLEVRPGTPNSPIQTSPTLGVRMPHPPPPSYHSGMATSHSGIYHAPADR